MRARELLNNELDQKRQIMRILILGIFFSLLPTSVFCKSDDFLAFIDDFAQHQIVLEETEGAGFKVASLSDAELSLLKNAVYARHGFIFNDKEIKNFFLSRTWYKPISRQVALSKIDELNLKYIAKFEKPRELNFSEFIQLFKVGKLPLTLTAENYGSKYSKTIPLYFVKNYFNMISTEFKAVDVLSSNDNYSLLLYNQLWAGSHFSIATFSNTGEIISRQSLGKFTGDLSGYTSSQIFISSDLKITVIQSFFETEGDHEKKIEEATEHFYVTSNGTIQKALK